MPRDHADNSSDADDRLNRFNRLVADALPAMRQEFHRAVGIGSWLDRRMVGFASLCPPYLATILLVGTAIACVSCTDGKTATQHPAQMNASPPKAQTWEDALHRLQLGVTVEDFKRSVCALHNALDSTMLILPPHHLYTYGSSLCSKTILLFHVASGESLYYALFEDDALATVFRETSQLADIRLAIKSALESDLLVSLSKLESEIDHRGAAIPQRELAGDARSYLRKREMREKHLEPSPLLGPFGDNTINTYNRSRKLVEKYDMTPFRIGANTQEVLDNFDEPITNFRLADRNVFVLGEIMATGWFPNPRVVIAANDKNEIVQIFTFYAREY